MMCGTLPFEDPSTAKLYEKILGGQYQRPAFLSDAAVSVIQGLLTTDPDERLTVALAKEHPWMNGYPDAPEIMPFFNAVGCGMAGCPQCANWEPLNANLDGAILTIMEQ